MNSSTSISERAGRFLSAHLAAGRRSSQPRGGGGLGRAYLAHLGLLAALLVSLGGLLVWSVDPYGVLGRNRIGIYAESERQAKPPMLRASGAHTVLIGSSKVAYTDPAPLGSDAFNASFSAAMPEEIANFLRHHVAPGSTVMVGLDAIMMNTSAYPLTPDTFTQAPGAFDTLSYVFGLRPAWAAVEAVASRARGEPPVLKANGQRDPTVRLARHAAMTERDDGPWLDYLRTHQFADFRYSQERVAALSDILAVAKSRQLTLYVFINPLSAPVRALLRDLPAWHDVARFRADVQAVLPGTVDLCLAPGWDAPEGYFRFDPFHYLPQTGERILRTVMTRPPVYSPAGRELPFGVVRGDDYARPPGSLTLNPEIRRRAANGSPHDRSREAVQ